MAIDLEIRDHVALVTMNRPAALNAFSPAQLDELAQVLRDVAENRDVRAVVLTGAGERAFAAGADIKAMAGMNPAEALEFARKGQSVANALERMPQPVIAAVNGYAFGGGCELAIACDIRLASENASFAQPEVSLGIPPGWGGSQLLPRLVGPGYAAEMILTGRHVMAEEALRIGLVNAVYPLPRLLDEANSMADQIARNGPGAVREAKSLMWLAFAGTPGAGLAAEAAAFAAAFSGAEQSEGMQAFLEKRTPEFGVPN